MATFTQNLHPIDFLAVAKWQYGPTATLHPTTDHAYSWNAKLPSSDAKLPLDLKLYVEKHYGAQCRIVQRGFGRYDWARYYPLDVDNNWTIQPIVFVASDKIRDVDAIRQGVSNFRHNAGAIADWYQEKTGKHLKIAEPQVFASEKTAAQWLQIYRDQADRFDAWKACEKELLKSYNNLTNPRTIFFATQFCGPDCYDWDWDAAGGPLTALPSQGSLAFVSAFACCHAYVPNSPSAWDETIIYAGAHELGHTFGLDHTPENQPFWERSIMRSARPPVAILTAAEITHLRASAYFS